MTHSDWSVYVLILLTLQYSAVQSTWYHVAQSKDIRECADDTRCVDFATFLQNTSRYISSNSTIAFYPGLYEKTSNLNAGLYSIDVIGVTNVTISTHRGVLDTQKAEIHCNANFKVVWSILQSQNIHIENMAMIGCSAQINAQDLGDEQIRQIKHLSTTLLLVRVANITFRNIQTNAFNRTALLGLHTDEGLNIKSSNLSGKIVLWYTIRFTTNTNIHVENSIIIPAINRKGSSEGFIQEGIVITYSNTGQSTLVIKNTTFYGYNKVDGFFLRVHNNHCHSLTTHLKKLNVFYAGISYSCDRSYRCKNARNIILIEECLLTKMCSKSALQIMGGDSTNTTIKLINTTFSDSKKGVELLSVEGFLTNTTFVNNSNALKAYSSVLHFQDVSFTDNKQGYEGFSAILLGYSDLHFRGTTVIERNTGSKQAAVVARQNSSLVFEDDARVHFSENQGFYGGALSLYEYSLLNIKSTSRVTFNNNHAWRSGGAIYVDSQSYKLSTSKTLLQCFYYQSGKQKCYKRNKNLYFCNNTSVQGGDSIYGGSIDDCHIRKYKPTTEPRIMIIHCIIEFCDSIDNSSLISSSPYRLCFCTNNTVLCDTITSNITAVPGETIELSVVAVGQGYGLTIATAQAWVMIPEKETLNKIHPHISQLQKRQQVYKTCTKLEYTVYAPVGNQKLILASKELTNEDVITNTAYYEESPQLPLEEFAFDLEVPIQIHVSLQACSLGFIFNHASVRCDCHPFLKRNMVQCTIQNQTIHRSESLWVNATENSIIIHRYCPLGYCKTDNMEVSLSSPDTQCSFDRSGTLCGQCRGDLSQVLGSLNCKECSDFWLFLLLPATLISGVVLVLFLMTLNLTVSTGTINGLIFYANIVRANNAIFFSSQTNTITTINRVFIAWINLDIGIEVCFYNGLDAYAKTLFQLAFPLYICTIVAIIITASRCSTLAARRNAVQVLATLFLLSYSKAIRLVITALSFTNLTIQHYPNNTNTSKPVWLYDGNVDYLQGKHIALFLIGILILVLVSLPYTTILLFSQCLQKISHYKGMSWVWKIKPLFDAYTGPYKNNHRYWTGLLLLVRVTLYAVFSLNIAGDPAINLLAICILILLTMTYLMYTRGVYKSWPLDLLESVFLLNLALLSTSTLFAINKHTNQEAIINISVLISIAIFCGITVYHTFKRIRDTKVHSILKKLLTNKGRLIPVNDQELLEQEERVVTKQVVSFSDLRESLLDSDHQPPVEQS